ncbi:MAG: hypothetical protein GEU78_12315 [Actinobacteria bacterium]|nr:hypothetical protein [Actinomycetota bacterium]
MRALPLVAPNLRVEQREAHRAPMSARAALLAIIALAVLTACGSGTAAPEAAGGAGTDDAADESTAEPEPVEEPIEVEIILGWRANGQFAPVFLALERGYFADAGLDVTVEEGGPGVGIELVAIGRKDFGLLVPPLGWMPRAPELELLSVALLAQRDPGMVITLGDSGIEEPADLEGRLVGTTEGGGSDLGFAPFLEATGVDGDAVETTNLASQAKEPALLAGQVDAITGFATDTFVRVLVEDAQAHGFLYADYGVDIVGPNVVTRTALTEEQPEVVRGVVEGILRAYADSKDDAAAAIAAAAEYYPDAFAEAGIEQQKLEQFLALMEGPLTDEHGLGYSTEEQWSALMELMDVSDSEIPPTAYFSNEFLPEEPIIP